MEDNFVIAKINFGEGFWNYADEEEKESEMQIGLPTDVKHVAHIGYDGSAANNPSWVKL